MELVVNGQARTVEAGTLADLFVSCGLEGKMVVAEVDGSIVPKESWASFALAPGMKIELVHFVGGG